MNEITIYGGLPMRRADVYTLAREHQGSYQGRFGADYIAFAHETVDMEPWPIDQAREIMKWTPGTRRLIASIRVTPLQLSRLGSVERQQHHEHST